MRKTIYVANEEVWEDVKRRSNGMGLSVSQYLLGGNHVGKSDSLIFPILGRLESKLDELFRTALGRKIKGVVAEIEKKPVYSSKPLLDDEVLSRANKRLLKIREESEIKFNPHPKGGKKGAK